jgi:bacillopeptidase F
MYSAADSLGGKYRDDSDAGLTLAEPVDLTAATSPILTFWHKLELNGGGYYDSHHDFAFVEVSNDGGVTWVELAHYVHDNNTTTWSLQQADLSSYAGQTVLVRFRLWDYAEGSGYTSDGWFLDDVEIRELF